MNHARDFFRGAAFPFKASRLFLTNPKYWRYAAVPMLLSLAVYVAVMAALFIWVLPALNQLLPAHQADGGWLHYLYGALAVLVNALAVIVYLAVFVFTFAPLYFSVASPFLDAMVLRLEGERYGFAMDESGGLRRLFSDGMMSMKNSVWLASLSLFWALLLFPLNFMIPVVGFVPGMLVGAHFLGLSFLVYSVEHRRMARADYTRLFRSRRSLLLGFSLVVYGGLLIPFFAVFFMPVAAVAGAMLFNEELRPDESV